VKPDPKIQFFKVLESHDVNNEPTRESLVRYRQLIGPDYYTLRNGPPLTPSDPGQFVFAIDLTTPVNIPVIAVNAVAAALNQLCFLGKAKAITFRTRCLRGFP
jgi:hypothetical protein